VWNGVPYPQSAGLHIYSDDRAALVLSAGECVWREGASRARRGCHVVRLSPSPPFSSALRTDRSLAGDHGTLRRHLRGAGEQHGGAHHAV